MSYDHIKVKDIIESNQEVKERVARSSFALNPPDPNVTDLNRIKFHDTIPVHNGLYELMESLHKEIPSIQFGVYRSSKAEDINLSTDPTKTNWVRVICEMYAYLPDDAYVLGRVGFADYCSSKPKNNVKRPPSYMVSSHNIANDKYDGYREQYNMLMSKNLSTAVSNAKKYLRQYSPQDIVKVVGRHVSDNISSITYKKRRESDQAKSRLSDDATIKELKNLVTSGYTFLHAEVEEHIKNAIAKYDEYEQHRNKKIAGKFVTVSNQLGVQMFDIVPISDVASTDIIKEEAAVTANIRYRGDEMPEDLMGRVAVLSMVQSTDYVEGVGNRLGDTVFWVQDEA